VVGEWADDSIKYLRSVAPTNVSFTGWIDEMALLEYYSRASVYIQASLHEGFGLSVAEAMLAGCIPVVANVGSLPEVVGNCGFYFNTDSPEEMANTIKVALKASPTQRIKARHRILMGFPLAERRKILEQIVRTVRLKNNIM
jgi:glycosyltransferase involved in cell wall biosynthesis